MNKVAVLLYNPCSGHREVLLQLDYITSRMQEMGYNLKLYRSESSGAIEKYISEEVDDNNTDMIIISGGDGTINECVNGMMKKGLTVPLAILPLGTANDFANTLGIPSKLPEALDIIKGNYLSYIDIGKVNDKFFINVCSMGAFSSVSQDINVELKNKFGKLAYYMKGFDALQHYEAMNLEIKTQEKCFKEKLFLVLVFNGKSAGGFTNLAHEADIKDGLFDVICFKDVPFYDIPALFFQVLQGDHLDNPHVIYFKTDNLLVKSADTNKDYCTDVDGELGPHLPIEIAILPHSLKIYIPKPESHIG